MRRGQTVKTTKSAGVVTPLQSGYNAEEENAYRGTGETEEQKALVRKNLQELYGDMNFILLPSSRTGRRKRKK